MKIEHKTINEEKSSCCNEYKCDFYRLDEWNKNAWFCGDCFAEELFNQNYVVKLK